MCWAHAWDAACSAPLSQDVPRDVSTTDRQIFRQQSFIDGCKV
jgi:hypothetical protein